MDHTDARRCSYFELGLPVVKLTILEAVVNENKILLDNIDSTDVAEIDGLTGIIVDEMRSEQSEIILDEGDPRNCQPRNANLQVFAKRLCRAGDHLLDRLPVPGMRILVP